MARPPLLMLLALLLVPVSCHSLAKYPEELGGFDLEVNIGVPPTAGGSNEKDKALLEEMLRYKSEQDLMGGILNHLDLGNGYAAGRAEDRIGGGNKQLVKRAAGEERQTNGRIRILRKRDNFNMDNMDSFNMDGKIRILKRAEYEMNSLRRLLEDQKNIERRKNLLKICDDNSYNMDGRIRILKRAYQERVGKTKV